MEYKVFVAQPKSVDGRTVTGIAAVTGNIDTGMDRILKGAFRKTLKENGKRVRHLWMHDPFQPPTAVIKELVEVGREDLPEDVTKDSPEVTGGLQVVREYLDTPRGNEILSGIKAGAIGEMSFAYDPVKFDYEELKGDDAQGRMVRNLKELRLWDTSDVTWGMNELTVAAKYAPLLTAYQERMPKEQFDLMNGLVTTIQEATSAQALKAGRVLSARNLEKLKAALDVLTDILLAAEPNEDDEKRLRSLTERLKRRTIAAHFDHYLMGD